MKFAIYARVSTIDKGQTLEQQENPLIEYCKQQGWEYEVFKDFASGAKESRPQLDVMMQGIRQGLFQGIIVYRLDRLGRSLKHLLQLTEEFENLNVRFIILTQQLDTLTPQGKFFLSILGSTAEFERQLIRERIKDKMKYIDGTIKDKGSYTSKKGNVITQRGRPSGSKDKGRRRKSGYNMRWLKKRQQEHFDKTGVHQGIDKFEK